MSNSTWYEQMAAAMSRRDRAIAGIERWTTARDLAEQEIQKLAAEQAAEPVLQEPALGTMNTEELA
jgi:hypothetical protein